MRYRFLEHTADVLFEAYGKSYEEALENAAAAFFHVVGEAKPKEKVSFSVSAPNLEELAVRTLSDFLSYMDINEMVFSKMVVKKFDRKACEVEVDAYGEKKRPKESVKAVTYHELLVKEEKGRWTIRILLDV